MIAIRMTWLTRDLVQNAAVRRRAHAGPHSERVLAFLRGAQRDEEGHALVTLTDDQARLLAGDLAALRFAFLHPEQTRRAFVFAMAAVEEGMR